jgi:hypothetical protein
MRSENRCSRKEETGSKNKRLSRVVNHLKTLRDSMIDPSPRIYLMPMEMVLMSLKRSKVKERKKNPRVRKPRREQLQTMMMTINRS